MKTQRIKKLVVLATTFNIIISSIIQLPREVFASEMYRLELFNQLAEKVTSLYYKEAIVGLVVSDEIYSDPNLKLNIEKHLEKDQEIKNYLLEKGFDKTKINEIVDSLAKIVPSIEDMENEANKNIIKRLINTTLVEEDGTLSFSDYDEDIKQFGKSMYEILPNGASEVIDQYFQTEEDKIDAMIKITIEFLYSGYGKVKYDEATNQYIDLELMINDRFIENVNDTLGLKLLNTNTKRSINIFLSALQETIEDNELTRVYTDIAMVLNMVGTHPDMLRMSDGTSKGVKLENIEQVELSRGEALKLILDSLSLEPMEYTTIFKDVKADYIYSGYISKAKNIGIINGYIDNTFRPMSKITVSETMSIINCAVEYIYGYNKLSEEQINSALKDIKHKDKIENWARESVANLVMLNIIENDYSGEFGNDIFINREEAIQIINKIRM